MNGDMTGLADSFIISHQAALRSGVFFGLLALFFVLERLSPRRRQNVSAAHFFGNLSLGVINAVLLRFLLPGGLVAVAFVGQGSGLMGALALPYWAAFGVCLVLLDLTLYWQHRLFHSVAFLWALHGAHHGDRNLNVSSGLRFHPGEALVSFVIKALAILLLGAPVAAVILFEVLLNGASLFNHANWSLGRFDRPLEKLIVTPDMHRLHHSRLDAETRKNFGFFLSVWDRLFASYQATPASPHRDIALGLEDMPRDDLTATLWHPFKRRDG